LSKAAENQSAHGGGAENQREIDNHRRQMVHDVTPGAIAYGTKFFGQISSVKTVHHSFFI
jgi:hypothetical protein